MPSLMEIFGGGDEVVRFEPVGPEDVAAAEQETDYVNHVFMQANPGFLILYSFIKDALLSKVGVVKVWWEERSLEERETYYDLPDDGYAILAADPDIEIVAHSARPAWLPSRNTRMSEPVNPVLESLSKSNGPMPASHAGSRNAGKLASGSASSSSTQANGNPSSATRRSTPRWLAVMATSVRDSGIRRVKRWRRGASREASASVMACPSTASNKVKETPSASSRARIAARRSGARARLMTNTGITASRAPHGRPRA